MTESTLLAILQGYDPDTEVAVRVNPVSVSFNVRVGQNPKYGDTLIISDTKED